MAKGIKPSDLGEAIGQELTIYHEEIVAKLDTAAAEAAKQLVKLTKATAPKGPRKGAFRRNVASKQLKKDKNGSTYVWYVKPPDHRLTHLLVHGHATKNGGRTKANPFLENALEQVRRDYEQAVEEAVQND